MPKVRPELEAAAWCAGQAAGKKGEAATRKTGEPRCWRPTGERETGVDGRGRPVGHSLRTCLPKTCEEYQRSRSGKAYLDRGQGCERQASVHSQVFGGCRA